VTVGRATAGELVGVRGVVRRDRIGATIGQERVTFPARCLDVPVGGSLQLLQAGRAPTAVGDSG
jgi:hypothetical protein